MRENNSHLLGQQCINWQKSRNPGHGRGLINAASIWCLCFLWGCFLTWRSKRDEGKRKKELPSVASFLLHGLSSLLLSDAPPPPHAAKPPYDAHQSRMRVVTVGMPGPCSLMFGPPARRLEGQRWNLLKVFPQTHLCLWADMTWMEGERFVVISPTPLSQWSFPWSLSIMMTSRWLGSSYHVPVSSAEDYFFYSPDSYHPNSPRSKGRKHWVYFSMGGVYEPCLQWKIPLKSSGRQEDGEFEASLGYITRAHLRTTAIKQKPWRKQTTTTKNPASGTRDSRQTLVFLLALFVFALYEEKGSV